MEQRIIDAVLAKITVYYEVVAYDEGGYGDNRSAKFKTKEEAIAYVHSFGEDGAKFHPCLNEIITVWPIHNSISVWPNLP